MLEGILVLFFSVSDDYLSRIRELVLQRFQAEGTNDRDLADIK